MRQISPGHYLTEVGNPKKIPPMGKDELIAQVERTTIRRLKRRDLTGEERVRILDGFSDYISHLKLNDFLLSLFIDLREGQENYSGKFVRYGQVWLNKKKINSGKGLEGTFFEICFSPSQIAKSRDVHYESKIIGEGNFSDRIYSLMRGECSTENSVIRDTGKVMRLIGLKERDKPFQYNS